MATYSNKSSNFVCVCSERSDSVMNIAILLESVYLNLGLLKKWSLFLESTIRIFIYKNEIFYLLPFPSIIIAIDEHSYLSGTQDDSACKDCIN